MNNLFSKENIEGSELIHLPNLLMRVEINTTKHEDTDQWKSECRQDVQKPLYTDSLNPLWRKMQACKQSLK